MLSKSLRNLFYGILHHITNLKKKNIRPILIKLIPILGWPITYQWESNTSDQKFCLDSGARLKVPKYPWSTLWKDFQGKNDNSKETTILDFVEVRSGSLKGAEIWTFAQLNCAQIREPYMWVRRPIDKNERLPRHGPKCRCNLTCKELKWKLSFLRYVNPISRQDQFCVDKMRESQKTRNFSYYSQVCYHQ